MPEHTITPAAPAAPSALPATAIGATYDWWTWPLSTMSTPDECSTASAETEPASGAGTSSSSGGRTRLWWATAMRYAVGGAAANSSLHPAALRARDPSSDERAVEGGVDADDAHLVVDHMGLEHGRKMPAPGAERREGPLPEPIERHVVVARHREGRARDGLDEALGRRELLRLRALREIARDDDVVRLAITDQRQHRGRPVVEVLGTEVDVGDVEEGSQRERVPIEALPPRGPAARGAHRRARAPQNSLNVVSEARLMRPETRRVAVSPTAARIGAPLRTPSR